MTDEEYLRRAARRTAWADLMGGVASIVILLGVVMAYGAMKSWQHDECLAVGHGETYCAAQTAGCFGGRR